jgi:hypothetical protein
VVVADRKVFDKQFKGVEEGVDLRMNEHVLDHTVAGPIPPQVR